MAASQDGIDSMDSLTSLTEDPSENSASNENENLNGQPLPSEDDNIVPPPNNIDSAKDASSQLGSVETGGEHGGSFPPNVYAPQAHALYYGGYENPVAEWEEYPPYLNIERMEVGPAGTYNENPSLMLHTAYGYSPQMPYGPYSPVTTPLPSSTVDGQLYSPQQFPFTGPFYQQAVPHSMPFVTSPVPISQADLTIPLDTQGAFLADTLNSNNMLLGPKPSYSFPHGSFNRGSFTGNSGNHGFYDVPQVFDGFGSGGFWSDWLKSPDGSGSLTPLRSPAASPQPIGALGSFGQNINPLGSGMATHQQRPLYGFGSSIGSYDRWHSQGGMYQGGNYGGFIPGLGTNSRSLIAFDKGRRRGKGSASLCSCNGALDFLSEQNRGPRSTRPKNPTAELNPSVDSKKQNSNVVPNCDAYNSPDFVTEYEDAKFYIIKSYSEDNVHKSIKYGVWASTTNGNKKLDFAYREAKENGDSIPVFLFFSVNASAQFCGVAEMIGPVDFERSVDYWQQDKWSGQFPVKWHIVKDVPNNIFRHIILENNDNKPVTNSRDTQEVKLEHGLEMLNIFKNHESDMSILDDFNFYEERERAMQERKAQQLQQQPQQPQPQPQSNTIGAAVSVADGNTHQTPAPLSGEYINLMSKAFAQAVLLEGGNADTPSADKNTNSIAIAKPKEPKKSATSLAIQSS